MQDAAEDVKVLQNLGRMKEFDVAKWVNDSYIRKAYAELGLDYDDAARQLRELRDQGRGRVLQQADQPNRARPARSGSTAKASQPFSSAACTLGAYADLKAKGKKINVAYVFDTARGIKLFADQAFLRVGRQGDDRAVPAQEGRRGPRRQERRQGASISTMR